MDKLTQLLREALTDLESLQGYFHWQLNVVTDYASKNIKKYKYSFALQKFFYNLTADKKIVLTEEEHNIIDTIIDKYEVVKEDSGISVAYSLKNTGDLRGYELSPEKGRIGIRKIVDSHKILIESTLITLLIKYEECITRIFRLLIEKHPEAYLFGKSISYSEIINLNADIQEVKERFIDKEIEEIMRRPISDWYKLLNEKHKIRCAFSESDFKEFIQAYYTRNIIVHNQGVVNEAYIKGVQNAEYAIGERISIDNNYIDRVIELTKVILIGTCWGIRKLANDKKETIAFLFDKGYDCLVERQWDLAKFINKTLIEETNQDEADILCERINYWIAEKNANGINAIKNEVEAMDTSMMSRQFVVAKFALLNEFEIVSRELEIAIDTDIPAYYVEEWPLLNEYRKSEFYREFKEKHKEKFEMLGYDSCNDNADYLNEVTKDIEFGKNELIEQLKNSRSFETTHNTVRELSEYGKWSDGDVELLCKIAVDNTQIRWIMDDEDIKSFYTRIVSCLEEKIEGKYTKLLKKILSEKGVISDKLNEYINTYEK